jgi:hypothetical protein
VTHGYICDTPGCGVFAPRPAATYEHEIEWSEDGADARRELLVAHLCADCAYEHSRALHLIPAATPDDIAPVVV